MLVNFDVQWVIDQFPALKRQVNGHPAIYFDGPGGTQVPVRVVEKINDYLYHHNANTHGKFITSVESDALVQQAREIYADFFNCRWQEVSFGFNSSSNNFRLALSIARSIRPGDEVLITDLDHEGNRSPWRLLEEYGAIVKSVKVDKRNCTLDMEDYQAKLSKMTKVVAVNWASNAVGAINDVKKIIAMAHDVGALTVVDAVHYAAHKPIDVQDIDTDFLICSAYKFFGPHLGVVYAKTSVMDRLNTIRVLALDNTLAPEKFEIGTPSFEAICGAAEAVEFIADLGAKYTDSFEEQLKGLAGRRKNIVAGMLAIDAYEETLAARLRAGLGEIEGVTLFGPQPGHPRTSTVSFAIKDRKVADCAAYLAGQGIFVWAGSFYAIKMVFEVLDQQKNGGLVRIGFAPYNTLAEVERTIQAVKAFMAGHS
ncbi:MAG: cysteine desulfurase-like protein [Clostridiales bacterium]